MSIGPKMPSSEDAFALPQHAFRQLLNPYKSNGFNKASFLDAPSRVAFKEPVSCIGTFWDEGKKKFITLNLGPVTGQIIHKFRVVPSADMQCDLSRVEGTTSNLNNKTEIEHRAERSEHGAESSVLVSGSYVIPGQVIPRYQKC